MNKMLRGRGAYQFWTLAQRICAVLLMIVGLSLVGLVTWWAADREEPVKVVSIRILPPIVAPGQQVNVEFTVDRSRVCTVRGDGYVFDGANVRWPYDATPERVVSEKLGIETYSIKRSIPTGASAGDATYQVVLYHACPLNPLHRIWPITDVAKSLVFEIVRPRPD